MYKIIDHKQQLSTQLFKNKEHLLLENVKV